MRNNNPYTNLYSFVLTAGIEHAGYSRSGTPMPSPDPPHSAAPLIDAIKVGSAETKPGEVTYRVLDPVRENGDKRTEPRKRTRLRSGKILDGTNKFLIDCQINNRSERGARLILFARIKLPRRIRLFSDLDGELLEGAIAWQRGQNVGVTFPPQTRVNLTPAQITALRKNIYVV
ncbi:hypothetical protein DES32_2126 [Methylovirgula ligni]|uniref:PilZ domain-containing protein n=2 Tax=Methylovirgula ligni TaxID=569860 RepID=A0A3D9YWJ5_9HYPH|nr:hypothetical protein [Methylovirgula ligni]REF86081.1 hypothetical protein DES32_2126 [Methylovirgula ligni]